MENQEQQNGNLIDQEEDKNPTNLAITTKIYPFCNGEKEKKTAQVNSEPFEFGFWNEDNQEEEEEDIKRNVIKRCGYFLKHF